MYEPSEDSFLLKKHIKDFCKPTPSFSVLDLGTGSGILAFEAAKYSKNVTASDIDEELIKDLKRQHNQKNVNNINLKKSKTSLQKVGIKKIKFIHSDLFSNIKGRFDLIIFNPPYLPTKTIKTKDLITNSSDIKKTIKNSDDAIENKKIIKNNYKYIDLDGGKNGTEIIERFLKDAKKYLKKGGSVLLLTSSLNKNIEKLFKKYKCEYKLLEEEKFFFEKLYVWVLR
ncbi:MAG: DUF2431 domain-containing protein [Candidatus Pacearchaeota archaeon]|nr:DUF2431 domain-containing protein [Candidatus Pacearchaeota archaeon]